MNRFKKELKSIGIIFGALILIGFVLGYFKAGSGNLIINPANFNYYKLGKDSKIPTTNSKTVIYFWATWCGVCSSSLGITKMNEKVAKFMDIPFISVAEAESIRDIDEYIKEKSLEFPIALPDKKLMNDTKVSAYPTFIFLNKEGKIIFHDEGIMNPFSFYLRLLIL